ncbi:c-type cytochrome [Jeongeupia naejangsanensis]|uniref:Cytochrome c5 family protein n=1 Tax=Jeongeupia naejangsanensis TaxID=613195 RepID=A0ABS2BGJ6_9NEIS|nr:c-type cytochrome [Jeongeupia naejangsanensis]MBM3114735.1 cytochrome c5 family protein [Jeongeupia naejangsanensis]
MSGSNASAAKSVVGLILTALVGIPVFIYLVVKLFTSGSGIDLGSTTMTNEAIAARLQAVGSIKIVDSAPPGQRTGKSVYEAICISCHGTGLAGSPKFGDAGAWAPHIAKGFDTLVKHAIGGFNAMPARGGSPDLTDAEVARAVAFMGNAGGAKFTEPPVAGGAGGAVDPATKGKEIYESTCIACHGSGAAGAPKFGDKAAWGPRLKDGADAAIAIGIKGLNAMPPKGGYQGSDDEFKAAALYMIGQVK